MPSYELDNQAAIVTGGGRGIGRGIALRLALEGAPVTVADLNEKAAEEVAGEIRSRGGQAISLKVDVTQKADANHMVSETASVFGRLDILVNNAGVVTITPALEIDEADWDLHMNVNAKGVLLCSQAASRQMIAQGHGGRIITIVSTAGKLPSKGMHIAAYVASKHAAVGLTQQMSLELAPHGILMNSVFPGIVDTEMLRGMHRRIAADSGEAYEDVRARAVNLIPLGRLQGPEDVANMVAFLASSDANYSVGQCFDANGGAFFW